MILVTIDAKQGILRRYVAHGKDWGITHLADWEQTVTFPKDVVQNFYYKPPHECRVIWAPRETPSVA